MDTSSRGSTLDDEWVPVKKSPFLQPFAEVKKLLMPDELPRMRKSGRSLLHGFPSRDFHHLATNVDGLFEPLGI